MVTAGTSGRIGPHGLDELVALARAADEADEALGPRMLGEALEESRLRPRVAP